MQNDLFSSSELSDTGFRLDFFQMYNWGVFDKNIYTMDCAGKSSLLTGANGSGKTTLVDAILSLLVPPRFRFYNQSSGAEQKKDRSEISYVRGAYGSKKDDEYTHAVSETLRDKNCYSLLLGCFINTSYRDISVDEKFAAENTGGTQENIVTLMQFRTVSADNQISQLYSITRRRITLEEINAAVANGIGEFDRTGKWKKVLSEQFGTMFYGDSFSRYVNAFSSIFGFRSDNALRLFSQTVGVKVLGNLNEFIRSQMLEEQDMETEFQKLYKNYSDLLSSYNEIEKTEKQLELLEPVITSGKKWQEETERRSKLENIHTIIPAWYAHSAVTLLRADENSVEDKMHSAQDRRKTCDEKLIHLESDIDSVKAAIVQNESAQRLAAIQNETEKERLIFAQISEKRTTYRDAATHADINVPETEVQFAANRKTIADGREKSEIGRTESENLRFTLRKQKDDILFRQKTVQEELASLASRSTNIPLVNIGIRKQICSALHCTEEELPFAGELLQIRDSERSWEKAIEKLLHNFALCVLVPETLYRKVTKYVVANNLKGRLVYFRTESGNDDSFMAPAVDKDLSTVPGKLLIKQGHPLSPWITGYLKSHFTYLCTDNMEDFVRADRALTSSGLIKSNIRHEKDDRQRREGDTERVLGWDNTRKKQDLSTQFRTLDSERTGIERKQTAEEEHRKQIEDKIRALETLQSIVSWNDIDTKTSAARIDALNQEKESLLKNSNDLRILEQRKTILETEKTKVSEERDTIAAESGRLTQQQIDIRRQLSEAEETEQTFGAILQDKFEEQLTALAQYAWHNRQPVFNAVQNLTKERDSLLNRISSDISTSGNRLIQFNAAMLTRMKDFIQPKQDILEKFPTWFSDTRDLESDGICLSEFEKLHRRLEKDDLPRYRKQFRIYLNDRLSDDIINFHTCLTSYEQTIREGITELNRSLETIPYSRNPDTHIRIETIPSTDIRVKGFQGQLKSSIMDAGATINHTDDSDVEAFKKVRTLIESLKDDDQYRKRVLDVRNWYVFAASEYYEKDGTQKQYYQDSASLSGGEKAKLAYTILASAIAFQFGINDNGNRNRSFRFVIVDEAFSKIDQDNSRYAMELFKQLGLQLLVVTPMDKINLVESYVDSVHLTENKGTDDSRLISMSIKRYLQEKQKSEDKNDNAG